MNPSVLPPRHRRGVAALLFSALLAAALPGSAAWAQAAGACHAASPDTVVPVVELYTSEGCSSCPPADRWASRLKADEGAVVLAFHVDYWNRLGWTDRFSSAAFTQRQAEQQATSGGRFSYTPQVLLDGADRKDWPSIGAPLSTAHRPAATVALALARDGSTYAATVTPASGAPARLAAYWAVTESGQVTLVKAGENEGATLTHDFVVRDYQPVPPWAARAPATLRFSPAAPADPAHPRQVNLVVVNADTGRPVQAVKLGC